MTRVDLFVFAVFVAAVITAAFRPDANWWPMTLAGLGYLTVRSPR